MNVQMGQMNHPLAPFLQPARKAIHDFMEKLPRPFAEFLLFGFKMAWACLFAAAFLSPVSYTHLDVYKRQPKKKRAALYFCA